MEAKFRCRKHGWHRGGPVQVGGLRCGAGRLSTLGDIGGVERACRVMGCRAEGDLSNDLKVWAVVRLRRDGHGISSRDRGLCEESGRHSGSAGSAAID